MNNTVSAIKLLIVYLLSLENADAQEGQTFKAVDHARKTSYHSPEKPSFTSWVGAWIMPNGDLMT